MEKRPTAYNGEFRREAVRFAETRPVTRVARQKRRRKRSPEPEGWLYLAVVLDLASRRVVGWALRTGSRLVLSQPQLALVFSVWWGFDEMSDNNDR